MEERKVLLVDNSIQAGDIETFLKREGLEVLRPSSRKELERLLRETLTCILCDPRTFGFRDLELLDFLKERTRAPIVVLTDPKEKDLGRKALQKGATDWIVKDADGLLRLPVVIKRLVEEEELKRRVQRLEVLIDEGLRAARGGFILRDAKGQVLEARGIRRVSDYDIKEVVSPDALSNLRVGEVETIRGTNGEKDRVFHIRTSAKDKALLHRSREISWEGEPAQLDVYLDISPGQRLLEEQRGISQLYRRLLDQVVRVLSYAMELRDPYTAGHQRRVAKLCVAMAQEMGLPEDQIEGLRIAAQLHDIGKTVSVPLDILAKPGRLTPVEWELIKTHPIVGHDLLKDVEFPWPVAQAVLQHHERLDGSGYPHGLKDDGIILEARIISVADVVEAMASHRPYRPALGIDRALEEIRKGKDRLYDPRVVEACLNVFESGFSFDEG